MQCGFKISGVDGVSLISGAYTRAMQINKCSFHYFFNRNVPVAFKQRLFVANLKIEIKNGFNSFTCTTVDL